MSASDDAGAADAWLPELVEFAGSGGNWDAYLEVLYRHFKEDFIDTTPSYPGRRWAMKRHPMYRGKEATFWHIISEGEDEANRLPDFRRCERIKWPRCLIDAVATNRVRCWKQVRKGDHRVAIATSDFGYLVILAERGDYVLLWTAYPVERRHQREKLRRQFEQASARGH